MIRRLDALRFGELEEIKGHRFSQGCFSHFLRGGNRFSEIGFSIFSRSLEKYVNPKVPLMESKIKSTEIDGHY